MLIPQAASIRFSVLFPDIASSILPDTWETRLSSGADKKESFEELLINGKLGKLATLRNLRNMSDSGISKSLVRG